jgi:hypothetical protein
VVRPSVDRAGVTSRLSCVNIPGATTEKRYCGGTRPQSANASGLGFGKFAHAEV